MNRSPASSEMARCLIEQIERRDMQCAFWLASSVRHILRDNPAASLADFHLIIQETIPEAIERVIAMEKKKNS